MSKTVRRIISTVIIVIAIIALTIVMVVRTSGTTRQNAIDHMDSITQQQSTMILNYVENAESTLAAYASANEIQELLLGLKSNAENYNALKAAAQKYTENFSKTVDGIEGIYVSDWNTTVQAHTNPKTVGITTRKDKAPLEALRKSLLDADVNVDTGVYNAGIIMSPATGKQIVSMYKAIKDDNGNVIGLVGLGIYTDALVNALEGVKLNSEDSTFYMVNTLDNKYIFCNNKDMVGVETEDTDVLKICEQVKNSKSDVIGNSEINDKIAFYSYVSSKEWLLLNETPSEDVFAFSNSINLNMILFCTVCIVLIIIFNVISIKQEETVQRLEQSKRKQAAITKNLHIAALKDILTDVNNRIKFIDDFGKDDAGAPKVADCPNSPYCFAMFNIANFSNVNINYGHDAGDAALASTADILKEHFSAQNIYRTGSDEFVVAIKSSTSNTSAVVMDVNSVLAELSRPRKLGNDIISMNYASAIVKKGTGISPAVLITLKDIINKNGVTPDNSATYVDLDTY